MDPVENERLLTAARDALFSLSNHWTYVEIGCDPEFASLDIDWTQVYGEDLELLDCVMEMTRDMRSVASRHDGGHGDLRGGFSVTVGPATEIGRQADDGSACDPVNPWS